MAGAKRNEGANCNSSKIMKCELKDDLISDLPDCLIQHILSFLPSTKDAIRTSILSKRWMYQWTRVPVLIFQSDDGMSFKNFSNFVDNVLNVYNCSKINIFEINSNYSYLNKRSHKFSRWILFATKRNVKELILDCDAADLWDCDEYFLEYRLPKFLFKNDFLVKLKIRCCVFRPEKGNVNCASLKALYIEYTDFQDQAIENVLSGTPVIEHLELRSCRGFKLLSIASKSLKTFSLVDDNGCYAYDEVEISCPNLEKLELFKGMRFTCVKLKDLLPSVCATLDFQIGDWDWSDDDNSKCVTELLLQVQHVQELKLGPWFFEILAAAKGESSLLFNNKCLTVIDSLLVAVHPVVTIFAS